MTKKFLNILKIFSIIAFWGLLWQAIAMLIDEPLLFPAPIKVLARLFELARTFDFYNMIAHSFLRVLTGTLIALILGVTLAAISAKWSYFHALISPAMTVIKSAPVASFIFLLLLWIGRDRLVGVISALIVIPIVWANTETGIKNVDKNLLELATVYRISPRKKLTSIYVPSVAPYFLSALRSSIGMAWKAGIAAEVLTQPLVSIGKMIFQSKIDIDPTDLFAWTLTVIILSLLVEALVVLAIKKPTDAYIKRKHMSGGKTT